MTLYDFRPSKQLLSEIDARGFGEGYLEYDDLLASGCELSVEEDSAGYLVLIESGESE